MSVHLSFRCERILIKELLRSSRSRRICASACVRGPKLLVDTLLIQELQQVYADMHAHTQHAQSQIKTYESEEQMCMQTSAMTGTILSGSIRYN